MPFPFQARAAHIGASAAPPPPPPPPPPASPVFNINGGGVFNQPGGGTNLWGFSISIVAGTGPYVYSWSGVDSDPTLAVATLETTVGPGGHIAGVVGCEIQDLGIGSSNSNATFWEHNG